MTRVALLVPLLVAAGFGLCAPVLARRLPPRQATWLLSAGAVLAALCGLAVLGLVGSVLLGEQPSIAREGHWSGAALRARAPVDTAVGAAGLTAAAAALAAGLHAARGAAARCSPRTGCAAICRPPRTGSWWSPIRPPAPMRYRAAPAASSSRSRCSPP